MAGDDSNPAIPAWQRAQKQPPSPEAESKQDDAAQPPSHGINDLKEVEIPSPTEPAAATAMGELQAEDTTPALQLQHMQTFLEDPAVKNASMEKKRAFFESKGIPREQIDKVLKADESGFNTSDFESFKQTQPQHPTTSTTQPQPQSLRQQSTGPPIITYPEFLVDAHKPPPLITPSRLLNTAYVVSGLAALLYGASKYLVAPMSDSLSVARHEFAQHSQSKIDEMNDRLTKLVSKVPDTMAKKSKSPDEDVDEDGESETSDPTELFHRDMGTQTSPASSRRTSSLSSADKPEKKDTTTHATSSLEIMRSHLDEMLQTTQSLESANKDKQENLNKLRSYLDGLMYASPGYGGMWSSVEGGWSEDVKDKVDGSGKKDGEDVIEELKKEIRGVKGVLLSAKRFPGVAGRTGLGVS
jgi:hypothetical protein